MRAEITEYPVPVGAFCVIRTNLKFHIQFGVENYVELQQIFGHFRKYRTIILLEDFN